ncbi:MAG: 6-phospho 3-hexuloisomerase, partial [Lachnospiraceae bacterium]|nr:6-phospho 3-hexuloisomerase [Lachnospiraceae bacterium]
RAKDYGGRILLITGNACSPLAELSDVRILVQAPDKDEEGQKRASVQPMGSLFEQVSGLVCDLMAVTMMGRQGLTSEEMRKYHANIE